MLVRTNIHYLGRKLFIVVAESHLFFQARALAGIVVAQGPRSGV